MLENVGGGESSTFVVAAWLEKDDDDSVLGAVSKTDPEFTFVLWLNDGTFATFGIITCLVDARSTPRACNLFAQNSPQN